MNIKNSMILKFKTASVVVAISTLSLTAHAAEKFKTPRSPDQVIAVQVAKNTYVLHGLLGLPTKFNRGMIANIGFVTTSEGVVVIDSGGTTEHAQKLLSAIADTTDKPVVAVINTHVHGDHWLGNQTIIDAFPDAVVYGHARMIERVDDGAGTTWVNLFDQLTEGVSGKIVATGPLKEAADGETLRYGDTAVRLIHTGKAHTDNDLLVHVEQADAQSVIFLGDLSFNERLGRMDDGHFRGNIAALEKAVALGASVYVPGHGPTTVGTDAVTGYRDLLNELYTRTSELFEEGLTDFEIKDKVRSHFDRWANWDGFEDGFGRHINLVYLEVEEDSF